MEENKNLKAVVLNSVNSARFRAKSLLKTIGFDIYEALSIFDLQRVVTTIDSNVDILILYIDLQIVDAYKTIKKIKHTNKDLIIVICTSNNN